MANKVEQVRVILERTFLMPVSTGDATLVLERLEELLDSRGLTLREPVQSGQTCPYCRGTGADPMSDVANNLPCPKCAGQV